MSRPSWEDGELDVPRENDKEYYFLAHVYDDEDRRVSQDNPDNQLRPFELGDIYVRSTFASIMPVADGVVYYWSEWPLAVPPSQHPTSLSEGMAQMDEDEFEHKLVALVRQRKGDAADQDR